MKKVISLCILSGIFFVSSIAGNAQSTTQIKETQTIKLIDLAGHWSEAAFKNLAEKNAIPFSEGDYMPDKAICKSELVIMLHKALGIKIAYLKAPEIKDYFTDVKQDAPYTSALIDLVTSNIFEGGGSFNPEGYVTREELVHYIMNAYKYKMGDKYKEVKIMPSSFNDSEKINILYNGDVARAVNLKLVQGVGDNSFQPTDNATRAEAAVVIDKLVGLLQKENSGVSVKPYATLKDDTLELKLSIANNLENGVTINHVSGQKFDFILMDANKKELYKWSSDKMFTMALCNTNIEAGKPTEFTVIVNKDTYNSIKDKIVYLKAYIIGSSDAFDINSEGYEVKIGD